MKTFDLNYHLEKIKNQSNKDNLGMILIHNGVVRGTSKNGRSVTQLTVSCNKEKLSDLLHQIKSKDFVEDCIIWINEGTLRVGDDIMWVILAGNYRKKLLPLLKDIIEIIKTEIVYEEEQ